MTDPTGKDLQTVALTTSADVAAARRQVRHRAAALGFDLVSQTKLVTAASELARNTVIYGLGGELVMDVVNDGSRTRPRTGIRLVFTDHGPGIENIDRAMTGGWTSGSGLGLGLPGSRRLVHEFELTSVPGQGTSVQVIVWRRDA